MRHLEWLERPSIPARTATGDRPGPALVAAFEGWNDAGDAATGAVEHLWEQWHATTIASISPEEFYDFTSTRPEIRIDPAGDRTVDWPANEFGWAEPVGTGGVVLLRGVEPQSRWRTFEEHVLAVAVELGCSMLLTLGALLADTPHTRPSPVFATSEDEELRRQFGLGPSDYEGPTGIVGVLGAEATAAGLPTIALWAAVPSYAPSTPSPKAAGALCSRAVSLLGTGVDTTVLAASTVSYERQLDQLVAEDDATLEYVRLLEHQYDGSDASAAGTDGGDGLADEVERFLRDQ